MELALTYLLRYHDDGDVFLDRIVTGDSSTPVVQWLSYSPLDPRFAGSIPAGVDGFFSELKNPEYDFLRKRNKAVGLVS